MDDEKRILRNIRISKGISLEIFADIAGISIDRAKKLENNPNELSKVSSSTFKKIVDALDIEGSDIQLKTKMKTKKIPLSPTKIE